MLTATACVQFIARKNKANKANMEARLSGRSPDVATRLLRGLSGAKVTKAASFRGADGESAFVTCSYRTDAGAPPPACCWPAHALAPSTP